MLRLCPDALIGQSEVMIDQKSQWEFLIRKMDADDNMLSFERQRMPQSKLMAAWWLLPPVSVHQASFIATTLHQ
jgi:hypothetical protein